MKTLFVTTDSVDCNNHVQAWDSAFPKCVHHSINARGIRNDWQIIALAKELEPDVLFYIGAVEGSGIPKIGTFQALRDITKTINLCSDAKDHPWHKVLKHYKKHGCFDAQVSIDGAKDAPVDLATLTPIDASMFHVKPKDIRFGFSGSVGRWNTRSEVINALEWFGGLKVRRRAVSYEDHVDYLCRTQILLNTSWTGTARDHHVKGRVIEAGYAKCALLEHIDSPISDWFPSDCYFSWKDPREAAEIAHDLSDKEILSRAKNLYNVVSSRYSAKQIYSEILKYVGITEQGEAP